MNRAECPALEKFQDKTPEFRCRALFDSTLPSGGKGPVASEECPFVKLKSANSDCTVITQITEEQIQTTRSMYIRLKNIKF